MSTTTVLTAGTYLDGSYDLGPEDIDDGATSLDFEIQRCTLLTPLIWTLSTTMIDYSQEIWDGSAWQSAGGFTASGGIATGKGGAEVPWSIFGGALIAGTNRQWRATLVVSGGPLISQARIQVN